MKTGKSPLSKLPQATWLLLAIGACLHLNTALFLGEGGSAVFRALLCAWSLLPYALLAFALRRPHGAASRAGLVLLCGALLILLMDACAWWSVFIAPKSSTAALRLLVAPFWNLLIAIAAWLIHKRL